MAKFSGKTKKIPVHPEASLRTKSKVTSTHEGGEGFDLKDKSALFLLGAVNMVEEDSFYETREARGSRFRDLIHKVTEKDPEWVARFIPYLRNQMHMRSASVVVAAEYVRAGGPNGSSVIDSALARPDEPAELVGYWLGREYGLLPKPIKRGLARAVGRLYTELSALKYDGLSRSVRMADVIELVHPKPSDDAQSALFRYLLDRRHHPDNIAVDPNLSFIIRSRELEMIPIEERRAVLSHPERLQEAGYTWERLSGWLGDTMDAEAWEAIIPSMGYMALLRNLRNFDEAGVSDEVAAQIALKLSDPNEVSRSRQFPFRFLSAYLHAKSSRWVHPLETALNLSVKNIPSFSGRTLVLTDTSGSMETPVSARSSVLNCHIGSLFAVAMAAKGNEVDLVQYASSSRGIPIHKEMSVLRATESLVKDIGVVGHGTNTWETVDCHYNNHTRIVIFTDCQAHDDPWGFLIKKDPATRVYTYDLGGYEVSHSGQGSDGFYQFGGFSDASFTMMQVLDDLKPGQWPF